MWGVHVLSLQAVGLLRRNIDGREVGDARRGWRFRGHGSLLGLNHLMKGNPSREFRLVHAVQDFPTLV